MHNNNHNLKIEDRRRQVASMLAQSMTETEIAEQLNVDQSLIDRRCVKLVLVGSWLQRFSLMH
jgi:DNA-binding NarL/FixJ family response regulator